MNPSAPPDAHDPYSTPHEKWLLTAIQRAAGCRIVIDHTADYPCSVDPGTAVICIRGDLSIDDLLYALPRAALVVTFGDAVAGLGASRFPLRLIHGGAKAS